MQKTLHIRLTLLLRILQASQATRTGRPRCGISHISLQLSGCAFVVSNVDDSVARLSKDAELCEAVKDNAACHLESQKAVCCPLSHLREPGAWKVLVLRVVAAKR
jgi:hypothetical protein